ncbi:hypothetical protein JCM14469_17250 [Desulfatiferula olefinivorans]
MFKRIMLVLGSLFLLTQTVYAADAVLEWDENADADYYVVYWSTDPDHFTEENSMEIPSDLTFVELKDAEDGRVYNYAVKAFNACGNSSDFSDTVQSAHLPRTDAIGKVVDTSEAVSRIMGAQAGGGGCFIGTLR